MSAGPEPFSSDRSPFELVKLYGLAGPPIGGVALMSASMLLEGPPGPGPLSVPLTLLASIPLGYLFGAVPALLTGLFAGIVRLLVSGWPYVLIVTAAGAVTSFPVVIVVSGGLAFMAGLPLLVIAGASGALVCSLLTMRPKKSPAPESGADPA